MLHQQTSHKLKTILYQQVVVKQLLQALHAYIWSILTICLEMKMKRWVLIAGVAEWLWVLLCIIVFRAGWWCNYLLDIKMSGQWCMDTHCALTDWLRIIWIWHSSCSESWLHNDGRDSTLGQEEAEEEAFSQIWPIFRIMTNFRVSYYNF